MIQRREEGLYVRPRPLKLSASKVEEILKCGDTDTATAKHYGVSQVMVTRIRAGNAWRSVYDRVILGKEVRLSEGHGLARNFNDCYRADPVTGCWIWTGAVNKDGYGTSTGNVMAHREAYERFHGPIPENMCVCHRCDTPLCVNPAHLFLGSSVDNTADRNMKGRDARGEGNAASKLTVEQVRAIRLDMRSQRLVASDYGVTPRVITLIRQRETWAWLDADIDVPDPYPLWRERVAA